MKLRMYSLVLLLFVLGCSKDNTGHQQIFVLSSYLNDVKAVDGQTNVPADVKIMLIFNHAIDQDLLRSAITLSSGKGVVPIRLSFADYYRQRVVLNAHLQNNETYTLDVDPDVIGENGRRLEQSFTLSFSTKSDNIIRSMEPCTNGCMTTMQLKTTKGQVGFDIYSNYPIAQENTQLEDITNAVIVFHGTDRNADDYFSYLNNALTTNHLLGNTILISPWFKTSANGGQNALYWNTNNWREGQLSDNSIKLSSFEVIDSIIAKLADGKHFPSLKRIVVTGHSSGAALADVYAVANRSEDLFKGKDFSYVVANSQFFYYPNDNRYDESAGDFYVPETASCPDFNYWPFGYKANVPAYLNGVSHDELNDRFAQRHVVYLLGNGTQPDPSLSNNCHSAILGSTRFSRGENMLRFMDQFYPDNNQSKTIVQGIGHDGQGMYQSAAFSDLLVQLLQ